MASQAWQQSHYITSKHCEPRSSYSRYHSCFIQGIQPLKANRLTSCQVHYGYSLIYVRFVPLWTVGSNLFVQKNVLFPMNRKTLICALKDWLRGLINSVVQLVLYVTVKLFTTAVWELRNNNTIINIQFWSWFVFERYDVLCENWIFADRRQLWREGIFFLFVTATSRDRRIIDFHYSFVTWHRIIEVSQ